MSDQWWNSARQPYDAVPFRSKFDSARDPLTARNAIGAVDARYVTDAIAAAGGGGGAPATAQYVTAAADATLTAERVLTNTATVTWDFATAGQAKANTGAFTGDVTTSAGSGATTIANDAVSYAKMQNVSAASRLLGRGSASGAGDPEEITLGTNLSMSGTTLNATGGGGTATPGPPQGRLTLQTATPVMTTTQSAKTTIFYTPYVGNQIPIYDGTNMVMTAFTELSVATTDTTKSPAAIGASKVNDWFVWSDAGTLRIGHGPDWTNDTTRSAGTALVMVNGILLNSAAITNGPAASRGTYVGSTRSNASSQLDWIYGTAAASGGAAILGVWNCYNRVQVATQVSDTTDSWAYATANVWRAANGSSTNRVSFVCGLQGDAFVATYHGWVRATAAAAGNIGVGLNSITAFSGLVGGHSASSASDVTQHAEWKGYVLGFNFVSALEVCTSGTTGFYGDAGLPLLYSQGLIFSGMM